MDETQHTQERAPSRAPAPTSSVSTVGRMDAAAPAQPQRSRAKVYIDRSSDFSTIHGETHVGDPHHGVMAYQNGLPFNHQDELIYDHPEVQGNAKLLARADKLIARAAKYLAAAKARKPLDDEEEAEQEAVEAEENDLGPVNLGAWARGQGNWPWLEVTQFIARKYSKRVMDKRGAIELCLAEHVVTLGQLSREHRKLVDS